MTPELIPVHIPLVDLLGVFRAAEVSLRFESDAAKDSGKFEAARASMPGPPPVAGAPRASISAPSPVQARAASLAPPRSAA